MAKPELPSDPTKFTPAYRLVDQDGHAAIKVESGSIRIMEKHYGQLVDPTGVEEHIKGIKDALAMGEDAEIVLVRMAAARSLMERAISRYREPNSMMNPTAAKKMHGLQTYPKADIDPVTVRN